MNASIYIFGEFSDGYTQYPMDNMQTVFQAMYSRSSARAQIIVYRDRDMMYYGYIRKLDNTERSHVGLCFSLNGLLLTNYAKLFDFFEQIITSLVVNGSIIEFKENGDVISYISRLCDRQGDVDNVLSIMYTNLQQLEPNSQKLPPVSFGTNKDDVKYLSTDSDEKEIVTASHTFSNTIILKNSEFDNVKTSTYRGKLKKIYDEKEDLLKSYDQLNSNYNKVVRQKKQFKIVLFLLAVLLIGGIGVIYLSNTLDKQVSENVSLSKKNTSLKNDVTNLNGKLNIQSYSIQNLEDSLQSSYRRIDSLKNINDELYTINSSQKEKISVLNTELVSYKTLYNTANKDKNKAFAEKQELQRDFDKLNSIIRLTSR